MTRILHRALLAATPLLCIAGCYASRVEVIDAASREDGGVSIDGGAVAIDSDSVGVDTNAVGNDTAPLDPDARSGCVSDAECTDSDPCTTNTCASGRCVVSDVPNCCVVDADCDDLQPCTRERCLSTNRCAYTDVWSCGCPDSDYDEWPSIECLPGGDCDDANALVHPGASESCSNGIDDDCNGQIDAFDVHCHDGG